MPICDSQNNKQLTLQLTSSEKSDASEAAKIKRIRENAYFNSYDFDAIEPLPSSSLSPSPSILSLSSSSTSNEYKKIQLEKNDNNSNIMIAAASIGGNATTDQKSYLKKFTSLFVPTSMILKSAFNGNNSDKQIDNEKRNDIENQISNKHYQSFNYHNHHHHHQQRNYNNNVMQQQQQQQSSATTNGFVLPRAMLKYQSIGSNGNSMPLTSSASSSSLSTQSSSNGQNRYSSSNNSKIHQQNQQTNNKINTIIVHADVLRNGGSGGSSSDNNDRTKTAATFNDGEIFSLNINHENVNDRHSFSSSIGSSSSCSGSEQQHRHLLRRDTNFISLPEQNSSDDQQQQHILDQVQCNGNGICRRKLVVPVLPLPPTPPSSPQLSIHYGKATSSSSSLPVREQLHLTGTTRTTTTTASSSNYSTEKSGSSGYYSSNLCSSSSVEEHIYSEPVIDMVEATKLTTSAITNKQRIPTTATSLPALHNDKTTIKNKSIIRDDKRKFPTKINNYLHPHHVDINSSGKNTIKMNESLRILETSIENLDRHLKNFHPKLSAATNQLPFTTTTAATAFVHYNGGQAAAIAADIFNSQNGIFGSKNVHLPTIMEGIDNQSAKNKQNISSWSADEIVDDSLMDIDLDSFLLVGDNNKNHNKSLKSLNEMKNQIVVGSPKHGIDNPIFNEEALESNYKCSKYVNSCPEDAYKLESDLGGGAESNSSTTNVNNNNSNPPPPPVVSSSNNNSIEFFLKKYEDQLHFQNTREMLEDIQQKIRNIATIAGNNNDDDDDHVIPKELERNINILKLELESYLKLMNDNNEKEIQQFCNGLVNNQKLVKITKAFERRKSITPSSYNSDVEYELTYEPIRHYYHSNSIQSHDNDDDNNFNVNNSDRNCTIMIKSSDPNFKLKRKSLNEIPSNNYYSSASAGVGSAGDVDDEPNSILNVTQLQRNLSYHKPILQKNDVHDKDFILMEKHKNKPSSWELYYGTNRINQTLTGKRGQLSKNAKNYMSYPSSRPESDFTLDLPRAEQLRLKMDKEKKFRHRCRILTTFLSLVFFLLTVMVVSLVLTRGKRMFGSML